MNDEELRKQLEESMKQTVERTNHKAIADFDFLSPIDMQNLLYHKFEQQSAVGFRAEVSDEVLDQMGLFRLVETYLQEIEAAGEIKLTKLGNLPKKLCLDLYGRGLVKEREFELGISKLSKEQDSIVLQTLKYVTELAGLSKKRSGKLSLTKKGKSLLKKNKRYELFQTFFKTHCQKFNLGAFDAYPDEANLQFTFGFTLYLLIRYGAEQRDLSFYTDKFLMAFPQELQHFDSTHSSHQGQFFSCYRIRIFDRFLRYYGFIDSLKEYSIVSPDYSFQMTDVFRDVFEIREENILAKK